MHIGETHLQIINDSADKATEHAAFLCSLFFSFLSIIELILFGATLTRSSAKSFPANSLMASSFNLKSVLSVGSSSQSACCFGPERQLEILFPLTDYDLYIIDGNFDWARAKVFPWDSNVQLSNLTENQI